MSALVKVCKVSDVAPGEMKPFTLAEFEEPVAIFNLDGEIYATSNVCTHFIAILTDGYFENGRIECPLHGGSFDVKTGQPTSRPCEKALPIHQVVLQDGDIYLKNEG